MRNDVACMIHVDSELDASADERGSLDDVFRREWMPLLRLAYLLSGSREDAQDAVQSAFLGAHQHWEAIRHPEAYLRRAVINRVKDAQRRTYRRGTGLSEELHPVTHQPELDETWHLLRVLPATQRAVVVLHYYEDLSLVEIAHLLRRPASTVRSDLRRAHNKLRKALS